MVGLNLRKIRHLYCPVRKCFLLMERVYAQKELLLMEISIENIHEEFYIPDIQGQK